MVYVFATYYYAYRILDLYGDFKGLVLALSMVLVFGYSVNPLFQGVFGTSFSQSISSDARSLATLLFSALFILSRRRDAI
jgi:hypothetical protein